MTDAEQRWMEVALRDRELRPLYLETRPTCDEIGVLIRVIRDDGQQPITDGSQVEGRLTEKQAEGLIKDLQLTLRIARMEQRDDV